MPRAFTLLGVGIHLTEKQNEKLRSELLALIAEKYDGNVSAFATKIKRAQPTISNFLNGKSGMSLATVKRVAQYHAGVTVESLIGPEEDEPETDIERDAAIQAARLLNLHAMAVANVLREEGRGSHGKSRRWWFSRFLAEESELLSNRHARAAR